MFHKHAIWPETKQKNQFPNLSVYFPREKQETKTPVLNLSSYKSSETKSSTKQSLEQHSESNNLKFSTSNIKNRRFISLISVISPPYFTGKKKNRIGITNHQKETITKEWKRLKKIKPKQIKQTAVQVVFFNMGIENFESFNVP